MYRFLALAAAAVLTMALAVYAQSTRPANPAGHAFYSAEQAERGKTLYGQNCSTCHLPTLKGNCSGETVAPNARYVCTGAGNAPPLMGDAFMQRWYSVGDLYARVRWSMPAGNVGGLSANDNLAVVAYLLQANGLPAGDGLKDDPKTLKTLVLKDKPAPCGEGAGTAERSGCFTSLLHGGTGDPRQELLLRRLRNVPYRRCERAKWPEHAARLGPGMALGQPMAIRGAGHRCVADGQFSYRGQAADVGHRSRPVQQVATTQPAYAVNALSEEEYTSIVAYLLKQAGFPSGNEPLTYNLNLMRNMTMEKGYERLFNGKDLTGWGFVVGANCPPKSDPGGCAQTKPGSTFVVRNGLIDDSGTPHGYMYPLKKYGPNFTFRAEYRYVPAPDATEDQDFYGNSGYLLFIHEARRVAADTRNPRGEPTRK
jgi:mono/diheme cytochrome c family protein